MSLPLLPIIVFRKIASKNRPRESCGQYAQKALNYSGPSRSLEEVFSGDDGGGSDIG